MGFKYYIKKTISPVIILFLSGLFLSSCSPARRVPEGNFLLDRTYIKTNNFKINKDELETILKQKPNRRMLNLFRFHLAVYNITSGGKETKFKKRIKETVGEPPVLLDTALTSKSARQVLLYLKKKGYFNANVNSTIRYKRNKAFVTYHIETNEPYLIRNINFLTEDTTILNLLLSDKKNSLITHGNIFDEDLLVKERDRITLFLNNQGYYFFSKEYIFFEIDSNLGSNQLDLQIGITNPTITKPDFPDSVIKTNHKKYYINDIYIQTDFSPKTSHITPRDTVPYKDYIFIFNDTSSYRFSTISSAISLKKNQQYSFIKQDETYRRLAELKAFRFINIAFQETERRDTTGNLLNAYIQLSQLARHSISFETEGTYSYGSLGVSGNLVYQNRNLFGGAEQLEFKIKGGIEAQPVNKELEDQIIEKLPFNTMEIGPEMNLSFPKFLTPFNLRKLEEKHKPKTSFTSAYNFQRRPFFGRKLISGTFGYTWKTGNYHQHLYNPVELNYVDIFDKDPDFEKEIQKNVRTRNSYNDNFIPAGRYNYTYNSQEIGKLKDFSFLKVSFEHAGNLFYQAKKIGVLRISQNTIDSIPFAQYIRPEFDLRHYKIVTKKSSFVSRIMAGVGYAYQNQRVLPFQKNFFAGGANGIRAWNARSIGPGSLVSDSITVFDQYGEMQIEANLEYRFDIYKYFKGAIFSDIGNIWLVRNDPLKPGGWFLKESSVDPNKKYFDLSKFVNDLALGCGMGLRMDFNYFVIRVDYSLKFHDPAIKDDPWVIKYLGNTAWKQSQIYKGDQPSSYSIQNWVFGIGYPF